MTDSTSTTVISRRSLFRAGALLGGGALLAAAFVARPTVAAAKMPKAAVSYQQTPKGAARCDGCTLWQAPGACKVVDGPINPAGWCSLYVRKS